MQDDVRPGKIRFDLQCLQIKINRSGDIEDSEVRLGDVVPVLCSQWGDLIDLPEDCDRGPEVAGETRIQCFRSQGIRAA